ncbi:hypothetical protein ACRAVF_19150 [Bradyrhizobium oligotrophicum S58]
MKVYLAARFGERPLMEVHADRIKAAGIEVTASWVYGEEDGLTREDIATLDLNDVDRCDTLISFTHPRGKLMTAGGGRHVEFGYALAKGKRMVVIGPRENVFHHTPGVEVFATLDEWLASVEAAAA